MYIPLTVRLVACGAHQEGLLVLKTPPSNQPLARAPCLHPRIHPSAPEIVGTYPPSSS